MRQVWAAALAVALAAGALVSEVPPAAAGPVAARTRRITVVFQGDAVPKDGVARLQQAGARVVAVVPEVGMAQVEGPVNILSALRQVTGVQYAAPTLTWQLHMGRAVPLAEDAAPAPSAGRGDLYARYQWDIQQVTRDGAVWRLATGSRRTTVAVIDTGVNVAHRDLAASIVGGRNFVPAGAFGDPTETGDPRDINDRNGHGSHVAGSIAGNGRIYGVGPGLGIRAYRVFGASGGAETPWIVAAVVQAVRDGADVINLSLGGYDVLGKVTWTDPETGVTYDLGDDHADFVAWKRATHHAVKAGTVVVAAAGNQGLDASNSQAIIAFLNATYGPLGYHFSGRAVEVPGGIPGVVTVPATGRDRTLASYSNYGAGFVDVAAPGGDVRRYPEEGWYTDMCLSAWKDMGDGRDPYMFAAGTSMAAPKVAAVAALYIDQYRAANGGARPKPQETVRRLKGAALDLGQPGYDPLFGAGLVDAYRTLGGR